MNLCIFRSIFLLSVSMTNFHILIFVHSRIKRIKRIKRKLFKKNFTFYPLENGNFEKFVERILPFSSSKRNTNSWNETKQNSSVYYATSCNSTSSLYLSKVFPLTTAPMKFTVVARFNFPLLATPVELAG